MAVMKELGLFMSALSSSLLWISILIINRGDGSLASALSLRAATNPFTSNSIGRFSSWINDKAASSTSASSDGRRLQAEQEEEEEVLDAVIIGAGWAGLGAAQTLQGHNILVLEARDYIGGRSRTVTLQDGMTTTELGSAWIVGANKKNPLYRVAKNSTVGVIPALDEWGAFFSDVYGVSEEDKDGMTLEDHKNAHQVPTEEITPVITELENEFYTFQQPLQENTNRDQSLRTVANKFVKTKDIAGDNRLALEYLLDSYIVTEYAASLDDLSNRWWNSDAKVIGGLALLQQGVNEQGRARGYSGVIDEYTAPFLAKIQLNAVVTEVDWNSDKADATGVASVEYMHNGVFKSVRARHVIVTIPLGVLKSGTITFTPSLPAKKLRAIEKLGMGLLNKAILKWDDSTELPWPRDVEWLERIAPLGYQGKWTMFFDCYPSTGHNIVVAWSAGREAERVEELSNNEIQAEVMDSLAAMFGDDAVPPPQEVLVTRWLSDEFARGSYSFYQVGSTNRHRMNLATSLHGRLFFAGEATSTDYFATTRGALETGIKAGNEVMGQLGALARSAQPNEQTIVSVESAAASGSMRSLGFPSLLGFAILTAFSFLAAVA